MAGLSDHLLPQIQSKTKIFVKIYFDGEKMRRCGRKTIRYLYVSVNHRKLIPRNWFQISVQSHIFFFLPFSVVIFYASLLVSTAFQQFCKACFKGVQTYTVNVYKNNFYHKKSDSAIAKCAYRILSLLLQLAPKDAVRWVRVSTKWSDTITLKQVRDRSSHQ